MHIKALLCLFMTLSAGFACAQIDSAQSVYKNLDTLKHYSGNFSAWTLNGVTTYKINDSVVSKASYDKYASTFDNISACTPCYFETYSLDDTLLYSGEQYQDCRVGIWREFYPGGQLKVLGHYRPNPKGKWKNAYDRGFCSVKEGEWIYYNESGEVIKKEMYTNGKLVE